LSIKYSKEGRGFKLFLIVVERGDARIDVNNYF
jgi:hypothetical protein